MVIGIDASRANLIRKTGVEWYGYYVIRWFAKIDSVNQYILYSNEPLKQGLLDLRGDQFRKGDQNNYNKLEYDEKGFQVLKSPYGNFKGKVLNWSFKNFWTQGRLSYEMLFNREIDILFIPSHVLPLVHPKKSVATIHDIGFEKYTILYRNESTAKIFLDLLVKLFTFGKYSANLIDYLKWSSRFTLKHSKKILTVSEFTKNELINLYDADEKKIKVIHNGYNKSLYRKINDKKSIENVKDKYGIEGDYLLYIGRIEKKKNVSRLIEAVAYLYEIDKFFDKKLVLVGAADYGYDEVNYIISQYNLDDIVIIPGWVDECDLPYLYNGASVFVFPSKYEGFGIPLLQAMACGVPVAASNTASIPEVVNNSALLFDPDVPIDIAKKIEEILNNSELREKLIKDGFDRSAKFSWERCARETLDELLNL